MYRSHSECSNLLGESCSSKLVWTEGTLDHAWQLVQEMLRHAAEHVEIIQAPVVIENLAARKLYYDLGFRPFGFESQALRIGDRYYDEEHIALDLRSTWPC